MAQYDLIFIKNNAVSGVSYTEHSVEKPPGAGFALTQDPGTGALSWQQSLMFIGEMPYRADADGYVDNGYFIVLNTEDIQNLPISNADGILQVLDSKKMRIQQFFCAIADANGNYAFIRKKNGINPWSPWLAFDGTGSGSSSPVKWSADVDTITSNYTLAADSDEGKYFRVDASNSIKITVPFESDEDFETGTTITFEQTGSGQVEIFADFIDDGRGGILDEVELRAYDDGLKSAGQYAVIQIVKVASDVWTVIGGVP